MEKRLTPVWGGRIGQSLFRTFRSQRAFNPNEEHMGSTPYGNANPMTLVGPALPQDIEVSRVGYGRVRGGVAPG
jgi:hypothetical protein